MTTAPLHPDFVAAIRAAWEQEPFRRRRLKCSLARYAGAIYWSTEDGRIYPATMRERPRLSRLAAAIRYDGPIVVERGLRV